MSLFAILSPAKAMQFDVATPKVQASRVRFAARTRALAATMRAKSARQLATLQRLSPTLAQTNADRWQALSTRGNDRGPAAMCFSGDVYQGLNAASLTKAQQVWLQDHVRILSGLYGLLRPMDVIQPYRLEMGTTLKVDGTANLPAFWRDTVTTSLKRDMNGARGLVNLASDEYAAAVDLSALGVPVLKVKFLQETGGKAKFMSFYAKRSRGEMARWMAQTRPRSLDDVAAFDAEGYTLSDRTADTMTFVRPKPPPMRG